MLQSYGFYFEKNFSDLCLDREIHLETKIIDLVFAARGLQVLRVC